MKHIYYYLFLLLFTATSCQQQQVPEVFFELDAQTIINQTRAMQEMILYQVPLETVIDKELNVFYGRIIDLKLNKENNKAPVKVSMENDMEVVLEFEVSSTVAELMEPEMELAVRYTRDKKKINVIEIKKATW